MSWLKWGLIAGGAYLGYRAIKASTAPTPEGGVVTPGTTVVAQSPNALLEAARKRLDPNVVWTLTTFATKPFVVLQGTVNNQPFSRTFDNQAAAMAWVMQGKLNAQGTQARVNWNWRNE